MSLSPRVVRVLLIAGVAISLVCAAGVTLAVNAVRSELRRSVESKELMLTASDFQYFVEQHGRWPESEEELFDTLELTPSQRESSRRDLQLLIVSYDCDLANENLDSPQAFRCLRPKNADALSGIGEFGIESLLETLRKARDGELPIAEERDASPAGQASPDDAAEESADEQETPNEAPSGDA